MNPSNGFTWTTGTTVQPDWFPDDGTAYDIRVWQANSANKYSVVPSYATTISPTAYPVKVRIGSSWFEMPVKTYNGSSWVTRKVRAK